MKTITRTLTILFLLISVMLPPSSSWAEPLDKISLQLKWKFAYQFAGYIAAKEKGFYADEGLDVTLLESGAVSADGYPKSYYDVVETGEAEFGVGDIGLLHKYLTGSPVVWLGQIFQHSPQVLMALKESDIQSPYDMMGKKVSLNLGSLSNVPLSMMLMEAVGDIGKGLELVPASFDYNKLITGEVDVISGYLTDQPYWYKQQGYDINVISPQNYGYDFYGDNLFTTREQVEKHPDRVEKMLRASLKGWNYALKNKKEIIDIILRKYNTQNLTRDHLVYEAKMTDRLIMPDLVPLGSINSKRLQRPLDVFRSLGMTKETEIPDDLIYAYGAASAIDLTHEEREWLRNNRTIDLAAQKGIPPSIFWNEDGRYQGIIPDYIRLVERIIGNGVRIRLNPIDNYLDAVSIDGFYGAAPVVVHPQSKLHDFYHMSYPFARTPLNVFMRKDASPSCKCAEDLQGKRIAVLKRHHVIQSYVQQLQNVTALEANSPREQFEMLESGQVDAVIGFSTYHQIVDQYLFNNVSFAFATPKEYGVAFGIKPQYEILKGILDKAIAKIDPIERQKIYAKWVERDDPFSVQDIFSPEEKAWIQQKHNIRIRVSDWPPYMVSSHTLSGASVDYMKAVAEFAGLNVTYKKDVLGWVKSMKDVQGAREHYDVLLAMNPTKEREKLFALTQPYLTTPTVIVAREDRDDIQQLDDLSGMTIAIEDGYSHRNSIEEANERILFKTVTATLEALQLVATGQVDAYIGNLAVANHLMQANGLNNLRVVSGTPFGDELLAVSARKDWPELASIIDKTLQALPPEQLLRIRQKWLGSYADQLQHHQRKIALTDMQRRYLRSKGMIRMCVSSDWLPYERITADGKYEGIFADYMSLFSRKIGVPFRLVQTQSHGQSTEFLKKGSCDIISGDVMTDDLSVSLMATKPFMVSPRVFAVHADAPFIPDFADIAGGRIGVLAHSPARKLISEVYGGAQPVEIETTDNGLRMVEARELDAFVSPLSSISHSIRSQGLTSVKIGGAVAENVPFSILVGRGMQPLVPILNKAIEDVSPEERRKIQDKWISVTYERGVDYMILLQISGVFILVIVLVVWRNRTIRRANLALVEAQQLLEEKNTELEKLSMTDTLTGLYNRRALEPLIEKEMGRRHRFGNPVSLLIVDIDHFKAVNDTHGHAVGDEVLKTLADEMDALLRETDTVARWGGEEFAILSGETDLEHAKEFAWIICDYVADLDFETVGRITISIGAAEFDGEESFLEWYHRADDALYAAKHNGRNRVEVN